LHKPLKINTDLISRSWEWINFLLIVLRRIA